MVVIDNIIHIVGYGDVILKTLRAREEPTQEAKVRLPNTYTRSPHSMSLTYRHGDPYGIYKPHL